MQRKAAAAATRSSAAPRDRAQMPVYERIDWVAADMNDATLRSYMFIIFHIYHILFNVF